MASVSGDWLTLGAVAALALAASTRRGSPSFDDITRRRVREQLPEQRTVYTGTLSLPTLPGGEDWEYAVYEGRQPGSGDGKAGRIVVDPEFPLAGLFWYRERDGNPVIAHVWVDDFLRNRGVGRQLVELYRQHVTTDVRGVGPLSPGGLALTRSTKMKIIEL